MNLQKKKPLKGWSSRELESEIRLSYCGRVELDEGAHRVRELPPRFDFFEKHKSQIKKK